MATQVIKAGNFKTRSDLESHVRNKAGLTPDKKTSFEIQGTAEELARLGLSKKTVFWGITCTDVNDKDPAPTTAAPARPERGDIKDFGLNGNTRSKDDQLGGKKRIRQVAKLQGKNKKITKKKK